LNTELFYAIIPIMFSTFCCSAIPTSCYIFFNILAGSAHPKISLCFPGLFVYVFQVCLFIVVCGSH